MRKKSCGSDSAKIPHATAPGQDSAAPFQAAYAESNTATSDKAADRVTYDKMSNAAAKTLAQRYKSPFSRYVS